MPMNMEYVLVTYGIWILTFVVYIPLQKFRLKKYQQILEKAQPIKGSV